MNRIAFGSHTSRPILSKVPDITLAFWVAKILTTAMGEAASDALVSHLDPYLAVALGAAAFAAAFALQFSVRRYIVWIYWLMVSMVSVFGTMVADAIHVALGVPYADSTVIFGAVLLGVLMTWYRVEGTLSIHSIHTRRRELFYWAAVVAAFALGTAAGDMSASTWQFGYAGSALLFSVLFALPLIASKWLGLHDIPAFWLAYILTRPMGASFADWFDKPADIGGLGYGDIRVALILTAAILAVVLWMSTARSQGSPSRRATAQRSDAVGEASEG